MKTSLLTRIVFLLGIYFFLRYFGGEYGRMVLYPLTLLVTFLHEFGHALGALLTGGGVEALQINENGSGYCVTRGGSRGIVLMGGYLGSAILGNLLFFVGARGERMAGVMLYGLAGIMIFAGFFWFNSIFTTGFLVIFAIALFYLAGNSSFNREILMFLGLATILYIIEDFNVGPRSDLEEYAKIFVVIPSYVWMYVWLTVAVGLTLFNGWAIFKIKD